MAMAKGASKESIKDFFKWDNERCAIHDGSVLAGADRENTCHLADITEFKTLINLSNSQLSISKNIGKHLLPDYFADDERFDIIRLKKTAKDPLQLPPSQRPLVSDTSKESSLIPPLNQHAPPLKKIILINGFLKEKDRLFEDWLSAYRLIPDNVELYGLTWSSKTMTDFTKNLISTSPLNLLSKKALLLQVAHGLVTNPWHVSMKKAADAGELLGNILLKTHNQHYTLVAHSLGCRVIYYAMDFLKHHPEIKIDNIVLLGGAIDNNAQDWEMIAGAISGAIYNCHSNNDDVLHKLYNAATLKMSRPIGYYPIPSTHPRIHNIDCSDLIAGHDLWKDHYPEIYARILMMKNAMNSDLNSHPDSKSNSNESSEGSSNMASNPVIDADTHS